MPPETPTQGFARDARERLPLPAAADMNEAQRAAAQALIDGPRKGVFGPFVPLMRSPELLERVAKLGEYLRFGSSLDARVRELVTCAAARHVGNQFEWLTHLGLAAKAGVSEAALEQLRVGARPRGLAEDEECALDFAFEVLRTNGCSEPTYQQAVQRFGEQGVLELTALLGYFTMINWVMNVARTPGPAGAGSALEGFPP
jgi:4-carboxymuconolactone decarboxylase